MFAKVTLIHTYIHTGEANIKCVIRECEATINK